MHLFALADHK